MGQSTNGEVWFGVLLKEPEGGLPWLERGDDGDEAEEWWREQNGFENPHESPFTDEGGYKPEFMATEVQFGVTQPCFSEKGKAQYKKFNGARNAWDEANPMPFEAVNVCSLDYPMYGLAVPGSVLTANRGCPERITLIRPDQKDIAAFLSFLTDYRIQTDGLQPGWILSSIWA